MFNVLPDILKEEIKKEYRLRRWLIIVMFILFIQISFFIFLTPSWLTSYFMEKEVIDKANIQNSSITSKNANTFLKSITEINDKLNLINSTFEYPEVLPIFDNVISNKSKEIILKQFTFETTGTSTANIVVTGVSKTREALVLFVKNLQKSSNIKEVTSPVSNLTKDKNIDFVIGLKTIQ